MRLSGLGERRKQFRQRGQSLLEMAFVVPVLLALVVGMIEVGRFAYISIVVGNAARAGAAYGAQHPTNSADTSGISNAAQKDFNSATSGTPSNGQSTLNVSSSYTCGCDSGGTVTSQVCNINTNPNAGTCSSGAHWVITLTVTASGTYSPLFHYPGLSNSFSVSNTAKMRVTPY